ncbi:vitelline membrane outer layer protein 1 homolog [Apteryx mantelli]|uniref:Vitelline membrane outer layer protein 1 homolog n=1 Tax=Apteryx mantelli TaxID=2696672 RepID=A0A8B7JJB4_9AVES|nr:vitelline membrane outer layer protein 1 homolog [Apteryx rowi]
MLGGQVLLLLAGLAGTAGGGHDPGWGPHTASVIEVANGGPWGEWAWPEMCPEGSYAGGVSFKVELPQGVVEDDTALNGVRLHCFPWGARDGSDSVVESQSGRWGRWSEPRWCPHQGHVVGFALRVQAPRHRFLSDEVAATNARFACSDGQVLEGPGPDWGEWGGWSPPCPGAVCGVQTRQEPPRGLKRDDTALNDLRLFCCDG